ncbi:MAG: hypothetical protein UY94_C0002G0010 [Parcubacteria group bacterium GW2011_GWA2_56_21]|nr:MAG: hypothetical protein UY94_C0002G0010 [Parcubacteria group bacterium GW2011_GWA2_56_21]
MPPDEKEIERVVPEESKNDAGRICPVNDEITACVAFGEENEQPL